MSAFINFLTSKYQKSATDKFDVDMVDFEFLNKKSTADVIFPLHLLLYSAEVNPRTQLAMAPTQRYFLFKRTEFLNCLRHKYRRHLSEEEKTSLLLAESRYFSSLTYSYAISALLAIKKPLPTKILNYYLAAGIASTAFIYAYKSASSCCQQAIDKIQTHRNHKKANLMEYLEETSIEDWKTYLYYYMIM